MEFFFGLPATVKICGIFAVVLVLNRWIQLSYCLFVGASALGLWMGLSVRKLGIAAACGVADFQALSLMVIVTSILVMSGLMKRSGHLDRIVSSFENLSGDDRMVGSVMPAVIGLLPMPGGALFSAPMVETAMSRQTLTGELQTAINYWFRHIWEYWWPLYPGVVLAVALLEVETWQFMAIMVPMTGVSILAGVFFILRPIRGVWGRGGAVPREKGVRGFLWEIMPIIIVVAVIATLGGLSAVLHKSGIEFHLPGTVSILPGLLAALVWVCAVNRIRTEEIRNALTDPTIPPMLMLVAAVMVFKAVMAESGAVLDVREELVAYHVPVVMIVALMPLISGIITGLAIGFVGTAFPLVIPLFQGQPLVDYLAYGALAYTAGYVGMMLSPIHLCFLVTKDYFSASLTESYRYLLLPALTVMAGGVALFLAVGRI